MGVLRTLRVRISHCNPYRITVQERPTGSPPLMHGDRRRIHVSAQNRLIHIGRRLALGEVRFHLEAVAARDFSYDGYCLGLSDTCPRVGTAASVTAVQGQVLD